MSARVAVIGAGAWGIALAVQAARAGSTVTLWARDPTARLADGSLTRLPGIALPPQVRLTGTLPDAADVALLAVPVQHLRAVAGRLHLAAPLVACCKGLERDSQALPLEVLAGLPGAGGAGVSLAVLSGPNFATEVACGLPAAAVLACTDEAVARAVAAMIGGPGFRLYASNDPVGVQVGGAAKNVIAIAAGAAVGAGLGENARAALITRGIAELGRLIVGLGGRPATAAGLSGLGDLVLTCTGSASRNYSLGLALGRGERLPDILAARSTVAEGVQTAAALAARAAGAGVSVPNLEAVALLLEGRITLEQAQARLLARPAGSE